MTDFTNSFNDSEEDYADIFDKEDMIILKADEVLQNTLIEGIANIFLEYLWRGDSRDSMDLVRNNLYKPWKDLKHPLPEDQFSTILTLKRETVIMRKNMPKREYLDSFYDKSHNYTDIEDPVLRSVMAECHNETVVFTVQPRGLDNEMMFDNIVSARYDIVDKQRLRQKFIEYLKKQ